MKKMVSKSTPISFSIVLYAYLMSLYFKFCVLLNMTPILVEEKIFGKFGERE